MSEERPDERQSGDGSVSATDPLVVLPSPNGIGVSGGMQGFPSTISPIAPQPLLGPADADSLATRVEDALSEDGRFTALVPGLHISAADGVVRVSGPVPSAGQQHSLLTAVRAVPGVSDVEDGTTVA